ncbi:MAG: M48 family peptidase [Proteobacteria bacterium]|nr:M48 family peptidase [Pseudomonadota bacterium]
MPRRLAAVPPRPALAGLVGIGQGKGKELRQVPYVVTFSPQRRRSFGFTVDGEGVIQFRAPRWVALPQLLAFAQKRHRFIQRRLAELERLASKAKAKADEAALLEGKYCALPMAYFKRAALKILPRRAKFWAGQVGVSIGSVRITSGRTVWGSCNSHGNLTFSWRLMQVPPALREYVVVHEICHRVHLNHGVRFWRLVEQFVPDYLSVRRELNKLGGEIG